MSDKRKNTDETVDPRVSAAYRDMADEHTPEHLDHVVLNAARSAVKPRWSAAVGWLRPAAWVVTVGMCLAIVVEIALLPDERTAEFDAVAPTPMPAAATSPAEAGTERKYREKERPQAATPKKLQPGQASEPGTAADAALRADDDGTASYAPGPRQEEFESRAGQQRVGEDPPPASFLRIAPMPELAQEIASERYCDESQTADPNAWLECILDLERRGLHEAARLERELLAEAFPPPDVIP